MSMALTEFHLKKLDDKGYVIIPDYYTGDQLEEMQAAQRRVLPTWQEVKENPPSGRATLKDFPSDEMVLLQGIVDHHAWDFARRWFETEHIHFRAGCMIVRYPEFQGGGIGSDATGLHIDNGNNSLLPSSDNLRAFGQLVFWIHLEDVDEDQAPLRLLAKEHGRDMTKCEPLVCRSTFRRVAAQPQRTRIPVVTARMCHGRRRTHAVRRMMPNSRPAPLRRSFLFGDFTQVSTAGRKVMVTT